MLLALLFAALAGCSASREPGPPTVSAPPAAVERPLVFVPGILGSRLVDRDTGRSAWGGGWDVLWPRDGGYQLALPVVPTAPESSEEAGARMVPDGVVEDVRLLGYRRRVYSRLVEALETRGYRQGDLEEPAGGDSLFLFDYDFRLPNRAAVERLRDELEGLRRERGLSRLEFDLLCQSNGSLVCRSLVHHLVGEADATLVPRRMALVGSANGGGLRVLRELRDGRRYLRTFHLGRHFLPEVIFSMRSVFDDLPHARQGERRDLFVDQRGRPLDVDLYDPESWRRYGWSVFAEEVRRRLERPRARRLFGSEEQRFDQLAERLRTAADLHARLADDRSAVVRSDAPVELLVIQARDRPTIARAVLHRDRKGRWRTVFHGDPEARSLAPEVRELLTEPGDGHATVASQSALNATERSWMVEPTVLVEGGHFEMILEPETLDRVGDFFVPGSADVLEASVLEASVLKASALKASDSGDGDPGNGR